MASELLNCLICNDHLNRDKDITVDYTEKEIGGKKCLQFQLGLQLLHKLLNVEWLNNVREKDCSLNFAGGDNGNGGGPLLSMSHFVPCCEKCGLGIEEIMRLQHVIEEMQISLLKQVDKLKDSLLKSDYQEDPLQLPNDLNYLLQLRNQLLTCARNNTSLSSLSNLEQPRPRRHTKKRRPSSPPYQAVAPPKKPKEYQPCSVILKRLTNHQLNSYLQPTPDTEDTSLSTENLITDNPSYQRNTRQSKLKAIQFIHQLNTPSKNENEDNRQFIPSPADQTGSYQDSNDNPDSGDDYPWESEALTIPPPVQKIYPLTLTPSIQRIPKPSKKFYQISPSILLYQFTLIKVTQGYTQFTCQSPQCPSPIFSDPSLNLGINLFYLIADHIETTHLSVHQNDPLTLPQKCPLCPLTISPGPPFRRHLLGPGTGGIRDVNGHALDKVVCEICWKPIRNIADFYRAHQWYHKNSQEKEETEGGPPPKVVYNARRTLATKRFKKQKNEKCKDPSILEAMSILDMSKKGKVETVKKSECPKTLNKVKMQRSSNVKSKCNFEVKSESLLTTPSPKGALKFILISPNTLLYQYTLIKVSQGYTQFTCQEPECPSPNFSLSADNYENELSNWRTLFDQIAIHIESLHGNPLESAVRECVLCSTKLKGLAKDWRRHFTGVVCGAHGIKQVICQICLKPMNDVADFYRCHQWSHKNKQEKVTCEEGPPPKVLYAARKKLLKKGDPAEKSSKVKRCRSSKNRGTGDQGNYGVKLEQAPEQENQSIVQNGSKKKTLPKFFIISEDTLLFKYTLIKVTKGWTHFTCEESQCPSPIFVTDELSNWRCVFDQIATHIESLHGNPTESAVRECGLCAIELTGYAKDWRSHLTRDYCGGHSIKKVVCDICLKPVRNVADLYRCHQWSHKTKQEKRDNPGGPPLKIRNAKLKYWEKKRNKLFRTKDKQLSSSSSSISRYDKICNNFAKIGGNEEGLLLYKYTLLKATYGVSLSCQQSNCHHITNGTDFTAFEQFKIHVDNCHRDNNEEMTCPLCADKMWNLRRHLLEEKHWEECRFICTSCWKPFKGRKALEYHQWTHKSKTEKETTCDRAPRMEKLKQREEIHVCQHCQREFSSEYRLRLHLQSHLPKEQRKKYGCPQCPRLFLSGAAVRGHVEREHERELMRVRSCPICNKEYNWRDGYKFRTHVRSHKNERNWICDKCGMGFLNTQGLKYHTEYMHGNRERSFQCEFCEMNYLSKKNLTRHRKSKHKDKVGEEKEEEMEKRLRYTLPEYRADFIGPRVAFPCPACEKVFPLRSRMRKHLKEYCKAARELGS